MQKPKLTYAEQFKRQLDFLQRSCESYDSGFHDEAIRIAVCIRVLIHNTPSSCSLLQHLNATSCVLLSTYPILSDNILAVLSPMVTITGDGTVSPALGQKAGTQIWLPATEWWEQVIYRDFERSLKRRDIVTKAANKDGGAHVDSNLGPDYEHISTSGWTISLSDEPGKDRFMELHYIYLQQMAYELLNSPALLSLSAS